MPVNVGDKLPTATVFHMTESGPSGVSTDDLFANKKVVMFAVPGAFTPTCTALLTSQASWSTLTPLRPKALMRLSACR